MTATRVDEATTSASAVLDLVDAWRAGFAYSIESSSFRKMAALGWTPAHITSIVGLATHAFEQRTALYAANQFSDVEYAIGYDIGTILVRPLIAYDVPGDEAVTWLTMAASAPTSETVTGIVMLTAEDPQNPATGTLLNSWRRLPKVLGPLAWAAGLTVQEASDRHQAGRLTAEELLTLLSLQGFRLPASLGL